jgi:hypothetical protein
MYYPNPLSDKRRAYIGKRLKEAAERQRATLSKAKLTGTLNWIASADPTANGDYGVWVCNLLLVGNIRLPEDIDKIKAALTIYDELRRKKQLYQEDQNILTFKQFGDLAQALEVYGGKESKRTTVHKALKTGMVKVKDHKNYSLYQVTNPEVLEKFSKNTQLCTAVYKYAELYITIGKTFVVLKNGQKYALIHFPNYSQFRQTHLASIKRIKSMLLAGINPISGKQTGIPQKEPNQKIARHIDLPPPVELLCRGSDWSSWRYDSQNLMIFSRFYKKTLSNTEIKWLQPMELQIRNLRDSGLPRKELEELRPTIQQLYYPNFQEDDAAHLRAYYRIVNSRPDKKTEKLLLKTKDPIKLVDYIQHTDKGYANFVVNDDYARGSSGEFEGIFDKKDALNYRWKAAEKYIFTDRIAAQRYLSLVDPTLTEAESDRMTKKLAKACPAIPFAWPLIPDTIATKRVKLEDILSDSKGRLEEETQTISFVKEMIAKGAPKDDRKRIWEPQTETWTPADLRSQYEHLDNLRKTIRNAEDKYIKEAKEEMIHYLDFIGEVNKLISEEELGDGYSITYDDVLRVVYAYQRHFAGRLDREDRPWLRWFDDDTWDDPLLRGFDNTTYDEDKDREICCIVPLFSGDFLIREVLQKLLDAYAPTGGLVWYHLSPSQMPKGAKSAGRWLTLDNLLKMPDVREHINNRRKPRKRAGRKRKRKRKGLTAEQKRQIVKVEKLVASVNRAFKRLGGK